jgi:hypothetical protein
MKRSVVFVLAIAACARPASQDAGPRPLTSASAALTSASAAAPESPLSCDAIFGVPKGGEKLCDEHVRGEKEEFHFQSYGVAEARATLDARYHERALRCQLSVIAQPPQFSIAKDPKGNTRLSTHDAALNDYPTCTTKASPWHKTVVIVSTRTELHP